MSTVLLILPAVAFAAWYLAVMVICGALTSWADKRSRTGDAPPVNADDDARRGVAMFLLGSAFAPCLIGVVAAAVWTVLPAMEWWFYPVLHAVLTVLVMLGLRKSVAAARADFRAYLSGRVNRRWALMFLLAVFAGMGFLAVHQATQPITGYDACTYALDARRVVEARDGAASKGFGRQGFSPPASPEATPDKHNGLPFGTGKPSGDGSGGRTVPRRFLPTC